MRIIGGFLVEKTGPDGGRLELSRLNSAVNFALIRELNVPGPAGENGNQALREAFLSLFELLKPDVFCDIGAHDGSASLAVREIAPDCAIYAFEANPQIHARHESALRQRRVDYRNLAVSDGNGRTTVFAPLTLSQRYADGEFVAAEVTETEDTGKTSLLMRNEEATYKQFDVTAVTLDSFLDSEAGDHSGASSFLWIDVEGAAEKVLAGAVKTLSRTLAIFIETENIAIWRGQKTAADIASLLADKGFVPIARDREYGDKQFNILFVNANVVDKVSAALFDAQSKISACLSPPTGSMAGGQAPGGTESQTFASLAAHMQMQIPVFIPCFNNPTYVQNMVGQLTALHFRNIVVVDGASNYPPMRDYLWSLKDKVTVVSLDENKGPRNIFLDEKNYLLLPQYFCVTDPDLAFNEHLPADFLTELVALTERHAIGKAGFALDISEPSQLWQDNFEIGSKEFKIWEWEEQFWQQPVELLGGTDQVYRAFIDTTFAVYNKKYFQPENFLDALRVAGRYTCRHLPWYPATKIPEEEEAFYRQTAQFSHYHRQITRNISEPALAVLLNVYGKRTDLRESFPEARNSEYSRLIEWAAGVCARRWEDGAYETLRQHAEWYARQSE